MGRQQQQNDVFTGGAWRSRPKIGHRHVRFIRQLIPNCFFSKKPDVEGEQWSAQSGRCAGRRKGGRRDRQEDGHWRALMGCEGFTAAWLRQREEGRCAEMRPHAAQPDKSRSPHVSGYYRRPISPLLLLRDLLLVPINLSSFQTKCSRAKEEAAADCGGSAEFHAS